MQINSLNSLEHVSQIFSHGRENFVSSEDSFQQVQTKIKERGDLPYASISRQIEILNELKTFPLGRFLVENGGLNGFWTSYILCHPQIGRLTHINSEGCPIGEIESFILNQAPTVLATQERFMIFKEEIQKRIVGKDFVLASVPCGIMPELLSLDYSSSKNFLLIGIDLDLESLKIIENTLNDNPDLKDHIQLQKQDAWQFQLETKANLIVSNGLNIYVQDDDQVTKLYHHFFEQLQPGGELITSFLTPPPTLSPNSEWKKEKVNQKAALFQKLIFGDIIEGKWQFYRSSQLTIDQLQAAGFSEFQIIEDNAGIFPTIIAKKPVL